VMPLECIKGTSPSADMITERGMLTERRHVTELRHDHRAPT
jgi:hypothetical protein